LLSPLKDIATFENNLEAKLEEQADASRSHTRAEKLLKEKQVELAKAKKDASKVSALCS
jgi:hypothetical protein